MKRYIIILLTIFFMSCNLEVEPETFTKTFVNNSSYNIIVEPNGQDWKSFYLNSGKKRILTIDTSKCYFIYYDANLVIAEITGADTVVFVNR